MIRPLFDNIIVRHRESSKYTESGLTLPDSMKPDAVEADVVAVSEDGDLETTARIADTANLGDLKALSRALRAVNVDDVVLVHHRDGISLKVNGNECRLLKQRDILAVITSPKTT